MSLIRIAGWVLFVGGTLGLLVHAFLHFDGHYWATSESKAVIHIKIIETNQRTLDGKLPPDLAASHDARVLEEAKKLERGYITEGFLFAGGPLLVGLVILLLVPKRKSPTPSSLPN